MASTNLFCGTGRLVRNVEVREVKGGLTVATFTLAIEHQRRKKDGTVDKEVCYIDCTVWGKEAIAAAGLKKGVEVFVKGRLKFEQWEKDGKKGSKHVVLADTLIHNFTLDSRAHESPDTNYFEPTNKNAVGNVQRQAAVKQTTSYDDIDSDLPF